MEMPNVGDQYNLKWNNHLANFVQTFIEHQHGESLVDVTLSCEGQYIKTHKLILSACSDYFHSIFQVHESLQHPIILLNGVRFCDLKYILHFMYHGEVKVLDKDLPNVLSLGETLQIKGLSSVKLRNTPPEEVLRPIRPKKASRKELNGNKESLLKAHRQPPKPLPSEIPHFIPLNDDTPFDYSRRKSPTKTPTPAAFPQTALPIITSVTSEAIAMPDESPSKDDTTPYANSISSSPKEVKTASAIPKPPHAFMIFANEWRKKLEVENPEENNKEISVRLGNMWKNLLPETKNIYYREAKRAEREHKLKYPNYVNSSPSDTSKRKAEVLNDTTNTALPTTSVDPMEVVEIEEQIAISDSD